MSLQACRAPTIARPCLPSGRFLVHTFPPAFPVPAAGPVAGFGGRPVSGSGGSPQARCTGDLRPPGTRRPLPQEPRRVSAAHRSAQRSKLQWDPWSRGRICAIVSKELPPGPCARDAEGWSGVGRAPGSRRLVAKSSDHKEPTASPTRSRSNLPRCDLQPGVVSVVSCEICPPLCFQGAESGKGGAGMSGWSGCVETRQTQHASGRRGANHFSPVGGVCGDGQLLRGMLFSRKQL